MYKKWYKMSCQSRAQGNVADTDSFLLFMTCDRCMHHYLCSTKAPPKASLCKS